MPEDYCCSVLAGVSGHLLDRLQSILNAAARLVFSARRSERNHPASSRPSLVAGPGTDSIPSLRSGIPMSQWISAAISRWERLSDSRCGRSSPPPLYHHDACCPVSAAINSWWPCLSCRCIAGMEQSTTCNPNCFILHLLSATTEDTSV